MALVICVPLAKCEVSVIVCRVTVSTEQSSSAGHEFRLVPGGAKRTHVFSNNCNFVYFQYKKIMSAPEQPVINTILITYINYSITENYIGKMASFLPYTRPQPLLKVLHHIYLPAISLFGVTSNQKSTFENLVQSTL